MTTSKTWGHGQGTGWARLRPWAGPLAVVGLGLLLGLYLAVRTPAGIIYAEPVEAPPAAAVPYSVVEQARAQEIESRMLAPTREQFCSLYLNRGADEVRGLVAVQRPDWPLSLTSAFVDQLAAGCTPGDWPNA